MGMWFKSLMFLIAVSGVPNVGADNSLDRSTIPLKSIQNANSAALGPVVSQGRAGWCFGYVAADLVSQELGSRVSPGQLSLNYLVKGRVSSVYSSVVSEGGGSAIAAINFTKESGFCAEEDSFGQLLQSWVQNPTFETVPDQEIPSITFTAPILHQVLSFKFWDINEKSDLRYLGTNCRLLNIGFARSGSILCDSYNMTVLNQKETWQFVDRIQLFHFQNEVLGDDDFYEVPENSIQSLVGKNIFIKGTTSYALIRADKNSVDFLYKPFSPIAGTLPQIGPRLAYLANQCSKKFSIKGNAHTQSKYYEWTHARQSPKDDHITSDILNKVDDLLNSGRILGLSYPTLTSSHIITVTGRICEPERIQLLKAQKSNFIWDDQQSAHAPSECLYTIRNSAALEHKYISAAFIKRYTRGLEWIE